MLALKFDFHKRSLYLSSILDEEEILFASVYSRICVNTIFHCIPMIQLMFAMKESNLLHALSPTEPAATGIFFSETRIIRLYFSAWYKNISLQRFRKTCSMVAAARKYPDVNNILYDASVLKKRREFLLSMEFLLEKQNRV